MGPWREYLVIKTVTTLEWTNTALHFMSLEKIIQNCMMQNHPDRLILDF